MLYMFISYAMYSGSELKDTNELVFYYTHIHVFSIKDSNGNISLTYNAVYHIPFIFPLSAGSLSPLL